ncbi:hypothetical protein CSE_04640 [Caldisericum exile AZM16c01]|uniref:Uncharacterized protein n=1 Tax=Caldisericum exile (strain DSM 21853 / NBRC 104410 / AZM16c01) TaxID=511051 RepID=A0A7U6GDZ1_CALEA|nr:hypothetical protein CSE_04640 [Caldisericum exile AZM16c01]
MGKTIQKFIKQDCFLERFYFPKEAHKIKSKNFFERKNKSKIIKIKWRTYDYTKIFC